MIFQMKNRYVNYLVSSMNKLLNDILKYEI